MLKRQFRVALLVESSHAFGRKVLQGIADYANAHSQWTFFFEERAFDEPAPSKLAAWKPDGIIARVSTPRMASQIRRLRVPTIDLYDENLLPGVSKVLLDQAASVRLAIEHLRECGFQNFAFTGFPHVRFSDLRERAFCRYVRAWGFTPHVDRTVADRPGQHSLSAVQKSVMDNAGRFVRWLRGLPQPIGLLACNDMRAQQVLALCADRGINVPDAIGVVGIDNDEVRCSLSATPLTSVDPNAYRIGYESAALLSQLLGRRRSSRCVMVDPTGVVPRRSTAAVVMADPETAETVRFIRQHACSGLNMAAVLRQAKVSRATLDLRFLAQIGRTPRAEIARIQTLRVRELLSTTDLPLKQIARQAGFSHIETMYRAFRKSIGQTPAEYRRRIRGNTHATERDEP